MKAIPSDELYTPEEIARQLGLHVRTVRRYVREGRLRAVRIGKRYRISRGDLDAFTGRAIAVPSRRRHVDVSSIVEVESIDREAASRLTSALLAAVKGRDEADPPLRIDTIHDADRARLKVILTGSIASTSVLLAMISTHLER